MSALKSCNRSIKNWEIEVCLRLSINWWGQHGQVVRATTYHSLSSLLVVELKLHADNVAFILLIRQCRSSSGVCIGTIGD